MKKFMKQFWKCSDHIAGMAGILAALCLGGIVVLILPLLVPIMADVIGYRRLDMTWWADWSWSMKVIAQTLAVFWIIPAVLCASWKMWRKNR